MPIAKHYERLTFHGNISFEIAYMTPLLSVVLPYHAFQFYWDNTFASSVWVPLAHLLLTSVRFCSYAEIIIQQFIINPGIMYRLSELRSAWTYLRIQWFLSFHLDGRRSKCISVEQWEFVLSYWLIWYLCQSQRAHELSIVCWESLLSLASQSVDNPPGRFWS